MVDIKIFTILRDKNLLPKKEKCHVTEYLTLGVWDKQRGKKIEVDNPSECRSSEVNKDYIDFSVLGGELKKLALFC